MPAKMTNPLQYMFARSTGLYAGSVAMYILKYKVQKDVVE